MQCENRRLVTPRVFWIEYDHGGKRVSKQIGVATNVFEATCIREAFEIAKQPHDVLLSVELVGDKFKGEWLEGSTTRCNIPPLPSIPAKVRRMLIIAYSPIQIYESSHLR